MPADGAAPPPAPPPAAPRPANRQAAIAAAEQWDDADGDVLAATLAAGYDGMAGWQQRRRASARAPQPYTHTVLVAREATAADLPALRSPPATASPRTGAQEELWWREWEPLQARPR